MTKEQNELRSDLRKELSPREVSSITGLENMIASDRQKFFMAYEFDYRNQRYTLRDVETAKELSKRHHKLTESQDA